MDAIIETKELTKQFGQFTAVDAISFAVNKGEIFGFLGANGAGKTTALRMLTGLLRPTSGMARVAGIDVFKEPDEVKRRIGYMSQKFSLYEDLTIRENIRLYGGIYGLSNAHIASKTTELLEQLEMETMGNKLVGSLPLGWKQKLAFSVSMLHDPKIVFLDEPTSGVDPPPILGIDLCRLCTRRHPDGNNPLHGRGRILSPGKHHGGWTNPGTGHAPQYENPIGCE